MSLGITGSKLCPRLRLEVVRGWWGGWSRATQGAGAPAPYPAGTPPAGSGPLLPPPSPRQEPRACRRLGWGGVSSAPSEAVPGAGLCRQVLSQITEV